MKQMSYDTGINILAIVCFILAGLIIFGVLVSDKDE